MYKLEIKRKEVHTINTWQNSSKKAKDDVAHGLCHLLASAQVPSGGC